MQSINLSSHILKFNFPTLAREHSWAVESPCLSIEHCNEYDLDRHTLNRLATTKEVGYRNRLTIRFYFKGALRALLSRLLTRCWIKSRGARRRTISPARAGWFPPADSFPFHLRHLATPERQKSPLGRSYLILQYREDVAAGEFMTAFQKLQLDHERQPDDVSA